MNELNGLDRDKLMSLYRRLLLLRRFEERVYTNFLQGEIPGTLHQYNGQEAVAVGMCDHLRATDWITSTHRPHGHALAKGVSTRGAMAELYGKATGCCAGKGGSMHLGDPSVGMLPAIAIVAGGNIVVIGMGLAFKLRKTDQVAVCFFGDGATNEGAFHESMNFAAVQKLPIVFVCENNLYGASTPYHQISPIARCRRPRLRLWHSQRDCGWHGCAGGAQGRRRSHRSSARQGDGPILLECKTYRFIGHSRGDARGYRSKEEEAEWKAKDCIPRLGNALLAAGLADEAALAQVAQDVEAELDDAVEFARNSPDVKPEDALEGAYA